MKILSIIVAITLIYPISAFCQVVNIDTNKYTQIPGEYQDITNLIRHIQPDINYDYWELVDYLGAGYQNQHQYGQVLFSKGVKPVNISFKNSATGFTWECPPGLCTKFIAYVYQGKVGYITEVNDFIKFIGSVDNLEEAVLLAEFSSGISQRLGINSHRRVGGGYLKTEAGYEILLTHSETCPVTEESIKVIIDKKGVVKIENLGVYFKSRDCYKI